MKTLGLMMINGENDVLERTLEVNREFVDAFYVLDGTEPCFRSREICLFDRKCAGYTTDRDLPESYGEKPRDGWRQYLYEQAVSDFGTDNWFLLLHGDEVWTADPRPLVDEHDGYFFRLPFYFPKEGETWDYEWHPLDQLQWSLWPGFPELRMFRGGPDVRYQIGQHHSTTPDGLTNIGSLPIPILHYLYRSPMAQRKRAAQHQVTGFDPGNYVQITENDEVYWSDARIRSYIENGSGYFNELRRDPVLV